ncbi:hypothetical protein SARC_05210 [Sphaeroforma arctica JP610]|uniref:Uncharacterized protein n=1 Tax=Sphaeroforma arctica JP610 TaxID=667725 RepID=A0A0L0G0B6_9EUKA|nr:hypothetical protein SARC_05210 [Sphaeroforma arctica JP610]KNC82510.1 hypothetical protein SARC_05210 [Sphaeroforma arctica JP610]|eukprot:XP_014156412.1 hypothetical protein SARC_05210 [Sphaeroforma arctica JP610]
MISMIQTNVALVAIFFLLFALRRTRKTIMNPIDYILLTVGGNVRRRTNSYTINDICKDDNSIIDIPDKIQPDSMVTVDLLTNDETIVDMSSTCCQSTDTMDNNLVMDHQKKIVDDRSPELKKIHVQNYTTSLFAGFAEDYETDSGSDSGGENHCVDDSSSELKRVHVQSYTSLFAGYASDYETDSGSHSGGENHCVDDSSLKLKRVHVQSYTSLFAGYASDYETDSEYDSGRERSSESDCFSDDVDADDSGSDLGYYGTNNVSDRSENTDSIVIDKNTIREESINMVVDAKNDLDHDDNQVFTLGVSSDSAAIRDEWNKRESKGTLIAHVGDEISFKTFLPLAEENEQLTEEDAAIQYQKVYCT